MSDVEFYGENENNTRFTPQRPQRWQTGSRGIVGLVMRWFGITNESTANYVLIAAAIIFFIASVILFMRI
ncbi:MAG: hypothetical protein WC673_01595 [Candidatus Paceibacterota bacterium]|jgi:hypothetical protein